MKILDNFTIRPFKGHASMVGIMCQVEQWHPTLLETVLKVGLIYAPMVVLMDITEPDTSRYAVTQREHPDATDLNWVCQALSRFEAGWQIQDGILLSPEVSHLSEQVILQTVVAGQAASMLVSP